MAVIGFSGLAIITGKAKEFGVNDPRIDIAEQIASYVPNELIKEGNRMWVNETWMQNQNTFKVDFKKKENDWQVVKYTDWNNRWKLATERAKKKK